MDSEFTLTERFLVFLDTISIPEPILVVLTAYAAISIAMMSSSRFRNAFSQFNAQIFHALRVSFGVNVLSSQEKIDNLKSSELELLIRKIEQEGDERSRSALQKRVNELEEQLEKSLRSGLAEDDGTPISNWKAVFRASHQRLLDEDDRLSARSAANLKSGIFISTVGVFCLLLVLFIFPPSVENGQNSKLIVQYGSRISLVILIQILGGFFLKMYVGNERDLYRNKNELTNLELRYAGSLMAEKSSTTLNKIAIQIVSEERNFLIGKSERVKPVSEDIASASNIVDNISKMTSKMSSGAK